MPKSTKTDNSHLPEKLALRRHFLRAYHAAPPRVFDACQGSGILWRALRQEFDVRSYWGVDVQHARGRLKIDSVRVLAQPGWDFDVIDVDTYGSPWRHYFALLPNVTRAVTVFLTVGFVRAAGEATVGDAFLKATGLDFTRHQLPRAISAALWDWGRFHCLARCHDAGLVPVYAAEVPIKGPSTESYIGIRLEPGRPRARGKQKAHRAGKAVS